MSASLLWVIVGLGLAVLFSYAHLTQSISSASLLSPIPLFVWVPSMLLTVTSFIYMSYVWIWEQPENTSVLGMYILFYSGAILYAPFTVSAVLRGRKTIWVLLALWLAASGTIGLFVEACIVGHPLLVTASCYVMLHHVFLDGIVWYARWNPPAIRMVSPPLFSLDGGQKNNTDFI